jgi:hypothetical protein
MRETKIEKMARLLQNLSNLGFSYSEAQSLRRIEMTLHRWSEAECGDSNDYCSWAIERDEETQKPYRVTYPHTGKSYRTAIPDRENGALERARRILSKHPTLWFYYQTDCRGCALYVGHKPGIVETGDDKTPEAYAKALRQWVSGNYNQGVAVCI